MAYKSSGLNEASWRGDLAEIRRLLDSGVDVNSTNQHGSGPLLTFVPSAIEYLLSRGADPNRQKNENGAPVLSGIAYMLDVDCVHLLLKGGADPNMPHERNGETALHSCLSKKLTDDFEAIRFEIVKLLIAAGADPNCRTVAGVETLNFWRDVRTRGETPLHRAAAYAPEETIKFLLGAGAGKMIRDSNGDSAQTWASWHWRPRSVIDLLSVEP